MLCFRAKLGVLALACLSACSSLEWRWDRTSLQRVLKESHGVGLQLDAQAREAERAEGRAPASRLEPAFQQPLRRLAVNSPYGRRRGRPHEGIDLYAVEGTPVYAAATGVVVYASDRIGGYGKAVVLRHIGDYSTLYAHNSVLRVEVGDVVNKGDCIAYSGSTGRVTGPHLHFEIRQGLEPVSPWERIVFRRQKKGVSPQRANRPAPSP